MSESDVRWRQSASRRPTPHETAVHATHRYSTATAGSLGYSLARNAFFLLAGQVGSTTLSIMLTAVLARWLGVVEFGVYYLVVTVSTFAYVVVDWGQNAYLTRESVRREDSDRLLGGALVFRCAAAFVAALATVLLMKAVGYGSRTEFLALLAVVCGLSLALSLPYVYLFRSRNRMDLEAAVTVAAKALTLAVTVPALVLGGGLPSALLMQAVGGAGALLVAVLLARNIGLKARRPEWRILQELTRRGAPIAFFFVVSAAQPFVDSIVLAKLAPPEVVGWYGAARNIMGVLFAPALILATASFPELSRLSRSPPGLRRELRANLRLLLGLGGLAGVGTFLFADVAVGLIYGRGHFDPAARVLQAFAPVLPLFFIDILFGYTIIAAGRTRQMAAVKLLSVAVSTGLAILLIPVCQARLGNGGIGTVLAFGCSEVLMLTAFLWWLRGVVDRHAFQDFLRAAAAAGGTLAIFWALPSMSPWLAIPLCVAVFAALALVSGLVLRTDVDKVVNLVRERLEGLLAGGRGQDRGAECDPVRPAPAVVREGPPEAAG